MTLIGVLWLYITAKFVIKQLYIAAITDWSHYCFIASLLYSAFNPNPFKSGL